MILVEKTAVTWEVDLLSVGFFHPKLHLREIL